MKNTKSLKIIRGLMLLLTVLGVILSAYLTYEYYQPEPVTCPFSATGENSCEVVRQSSYSVLFGVKLPVWGMLYYIAFSGYLLLGILDKIKFKYYSLSIFILALWGFLFEGYMTYVQIFKIEAICKWCTLVEIIAVAIFIIAVAEQGQKLINRKKKKLNKAKKVAYDKLNEAEEVDK